MSDLFEGTIEALTWTGENLAEIQAFVGGAFRHHFDIDDCIHLNVPGLSVNLYPGDQVSGFRMNDGSVRALSVVSAAGWQRFKDTHPAHQEAAA